jgi:hypothetical protein
MAGHKEHQGDLKIYALTIDQKAINKKFITLDQFVIANFLVQRNLNVL